MSQILEYKASPEFTEEGAIALMKEKHIEEYITPSSQYRVDLGVISRGLLSYATKDIEDKFYFLNKREVSVTMKSLVVFIKRYSDRSGAKYLYIRRGNENQAILYLFNFYAYQLSLEAAESL